jgi:transcriptional antiterminator RfaH
VILGQAEACWYLIRTKPSQERGVSQQFMQRGAQVLLPMIKVQVRRWNSLVESIAPMFPCYLFALFNLEFDYGHLRYTRGLKEIVCFNGQPAVVPDWMIAPVAQRCAHGPLELPRHRFAPGECVKVASGPLREFEGVFDRYLSGPERAAVLLSVMGGGARVVLPSNMVVPAT